MARTLILVLLVLLAALAAPLPARADSGPVTMTDYTDPGQAMPWGARSHWMQPWRSYLDTVPATTLLNAVGINFNVGNKVAPATARLLGDSGFRRARIEVGWNSIEYGNPSQMVPLQRRGLETTLNALHENGIRPLIVLNANAGQPCPVLAGTVQLTQPAAAGERTIHVAPADLARIVPGRTGIKAENAAAGVIFSAVDAAGEVELSKPLPSAEPAGALAIETLRYEPFRPETTADGSPNPANAETLSGWLEYVGTVTREAKAILGSEEFDVEVWNELSFGSNFLNFNSYYDPNVEWTSNGDFNLILSRTVEYLRDPANGVAGIGIGNGFANESPWWSGATSPVGLTAIDKHPYAGWLSFPADAQVNGNRPLNGLGEPSGTRGPEGAYSEGFTPTYDAFFPEYFLSGIQTETLVHDLSPQTSMIQGTPHGRSTHPSGGEAPTMWVTEANLAPGSGPTPRSQMSAADARRIESKDILRYLVAYVNKGVTALDFFAADGGELSLVEPSFFSAAKASPSVYPGDAAGGETMTAVSRLVRSMAGAEPIASPRRLALRELTDFDGNVQFEGNGTAAYPSLYNREVFAFLPFQVRPRRFVIPVYVMTRNVAEDYRPDDSGDPGRFDLPAEPYRLAIGAIDGEGAEVTATDPLTGEAVPVEVLSRAGDEIVIQLPVTDSPRLLTIQEAGEAPVPPSEPEPEPEPQPVEEEPGAPTPTVEKTTPKAPAAAGRTAKVPATPAAAPTTPAVDPDPRLVVKGASGLLTGQVQAITKCASRCLVGVSARLQVGAHRYPLRPASAAGAAPRRTNSVQLVIGRKAARAGRLAVRRGVAVKVVVDAHVRGVAAAGVESVHKVLRLTG